MVAWSTGSCSKDYLKSQAIADHYIHPFDLGNLDIDSQKDSMPRAGSGISYVGDLLAREVSGKSKGLSCCPSILG